MIVTCPNCETKFEIPDDKYRPGRKARCSNCANVFVLPEIDAAEPPAAPAAPDIPVSGAEISSFDAMMRDIEKTLPEAEVPAAGAESAPDTGAPEAAATMPDAEAPAEIKDEEPAEPEAAPASPASVDDIVPPPSAEKKRRVSVPKIGLNKKRLLLILGIALVVALLGYGGIMVYSALFSSPATTDPARVTDGGVVESLGGKTGQADQEKEAARQATVRRLALENVRQYTVTDNENTGSMVVVEGSVVNNFDTSKDLILLEVTLFDKKGNALVLREQYCGITLTPLQLRTLSKAAIEAALANQSSIIINNTDIPPGGNVAFTTVFFDLPRGAYEFEVKIVDVQDPAPKQ